MNWDLIFLIVGIGGPLLIGVGFLTYWFLGWNKKRREAAEHNPTAEKKEEKHEEKHDSHDAGHGSHGGGLKFPSFTFGNVFWACISLMVLLLVLSPSLLEFGVGKLSYLVDGPPPASSYANKQCPGQEVDFSLDEEHYFVKANPGHRCRLLSRVEANGIAVPDPSNVYLVGNRSPAAGTYSLCPEEAGDGNLNWDCSPRP